VKSLGLIILIAFSIAKVNAQTFNYTKNALNVDVIVSNPCGGSTTNGFITFRVNASNNGATILTIISGPNQTVFPNQTISDGSTFVYTPVGPDQGGDYDFIIHDDVNTINTFPAGPPLPVTMVDLSVISINQMTLTNNSNCITPNGQLVVSVTGGSESPALSVPGSFTYTWTSNNGLAGLPLTNTYDGTSNLNLATLLGKSGLPGGKYTLSVVDNYSVCTQSQNFILTDPSPIIYTTSTLTPSICLGSTGSVTLSNSEGAALSYQVFKGGVLDASIPAQTGVNGPLTFTVPAADLTPAGVYNFTIQATNGNCSPAFMNATAAITVSSPPTASNAGLAQAICTGGTATLAANTPVIGTGAWSVNSGPSLLLSQFSNTSNPAATFTPAGGVGSYVLTWTISNAPCTASTSNVTITINAPPTASIAGAPQTICATGSATLAGNVPGVGTGAWSVNSGPSLLLTQFSSTSSPTATFTPAGGAGSYVLTWTISNAPCTASASNVTITVTASPTVSNAGAPQTICSTTFATLAANAPVIGTGAWSVFSGPSLLLSQFNTVTSRTARFTPAGGAGSYVLTWTISNAPCTPSASNVTITVNAPPTASNAGSPQTICAGSSVVLAANSPLIGVGTWSVTSGPSLLVSQFSSAANPTATFTPAGGAGNYVLQWRITNAPCTASASTVTITVNAAPTSANAGSAQTICSSGSAVLAGNTPLIGTGAWSVFSGPSLLLTQFSSTSSPTATFTPAGGAGSYVLTWTISNAPCAASTSNVTITVNAPPTPSVAGSAQTICSSASAALGANTPSIGTGAWSVFSGPSLLSTQFSNVSDPLATFTPAGGAGSYVLTWTISNAPCTASTSNVTISVNALPTASSAGGAQTICSTGSATLAGNVPGLGTGTWSVFSGPSLLLTQFSSTSSPTATFTPAGGAGSYVLTWTISNAPCAASTSNVTITVNAPPTASVPGSPQTICASGSAILTGNSPVVGTGTWSVFSGPSLLATQFNSTSNPTATFIPAGGAGSYVLTWTITNAPCAASAANVTITVDAPPTTSNAGGPQTICANGSAALTATAAIVGTGAWSVSSGPSLLLSQFSNTSNPGATFTPAGGAGSYVLTWTISNAPCAASTSNVSITVDAPPTTSNAGSPQSICANGLATLAGNIPGIGTGAWSVFSGPSLLLTQFSNASSPTSTFTPAGGAGSYVLTWTISNAPCAVSTSNVTITVNTNPVTSAITGASPVCANISGLTYSVISSAGSTYAWTITGGLQASGGSTNSIKVNWGAAGSGNVSVIETNAAGCVGAAVNLPITISPSPTLIASPINVSTCTPGNDGSITVTASGGSGSGYTFSDNNGTSFQGSNSFAGLMAGNYPIVVQDGNACLSASTSVTINSPGGISISTTQQNVSCNGGNNGSITITPSGGSGTYTYSKDNGTTFGGLGSPFTFNGLSAATYQLVVKDGNGCQFSSPVVVSEPAVLLFTTSQTNVSCNGGSDGIISVTPSGGNGSYQYSNDGGATFQLGNSYLGLSSGSYNVVVKDVNNCTLGTVVTLTQPTVLAFTTIKTDVTACLPGNDGTITVSASGGTGAYQYSDDNGTTFQIGSSFTHLTPGFYNVIVKDANNCQTSATAVSIGTPGGLTFTTAKLDAVCNGTASGSITISASGGNGTYAYSNDNGATFSAPSSVTPFTFNALPASTYPLIVKDGNGCQFSSSVTINQPTAVTFTFVETDATCSGAANGSITITASGGNNSYSYSIDNGTTFHASNAFSNLTAQPYQVVVMDGNSCLSAGSPVTVGAGTLTPIYNKTDATCAANDGSIIISSVTGGASPYQYSVDNGTTYQASNSFSSLTVATYSLVVKDNNGCTSSAISIAVSKPPVCGGTNCGAFTIIATDTRPSCSNQNDGTITINVTGGSPNYQVTLLDPSISFNQALSGPGPFTFVNLSPSLTYQYTILDGAGNTCTLPYSLPIQSTVQAIASGFVDAQCYNQAVGQATITVNSGGTSPYSYSLDNGVTWVSFTSPYTISNLMPSPSPYSILVADDPSDACPAQVTVTINNAVTNILTTFIATDASCSNNDGKIQIKNISGGTAPYTYRLDSVSQLMPSDSTFTGLSGGVHTFTVIDANGCSKYFKTTVSFPGLVNLTTVVNSPSCTGNGNDGNVIATITSSGTFSIGITTSPNNDPIVFRTVVSAGTSTASFDSLSQGIYYVVAKPVGALCPTRSSVTIGGGPVAVNFSFTTKNFICFETKGTVDLYGIKGSASVDYSYEVINLGNVVQSGTITQLQALDTVSLPGLSSGSYQVHLFQDQSATSGCTAPIASAFKPFTITGPTASLDTLFVNKNFSLPNLPSGSMLIGIKESQEQPYQLMLQLITPFIQGQKNPNAFDSVWVNVPRNNQNQIVELDATNLYPGDYRLSIRDTLGCAKTYDISLKTATGIFIPNIFTPNNDGKNDTFEIINLPNAAPNQASLVITNRWGKQVFESNSYGYNNSWWNGGAEADGIYYYRLNAGGKSYTGWVEILHPSY